MSTDIPAYSLRARAALPVSDEEVVFRQVLLAAERAQQELGAVTSAAVVARANLPESQVLPILGSAKFEFMAAERGVQLVSAGVTPRMEDAARAYFNTENGKGWTHHRKLAAAGVTPMQWANWMQVPAFEQFVRRTADALTQSAIIRADVALAEQAGEGNLRAIDYLYKKTGTYDSTSSGLDIRAVLDGVFEVLESSDLDPVLLRSIAERVQNILTVQSAVAAAGPKQIGA